MKELTVKAGEKSYQVYIGCGGIEKIWDALHTLEQTPKKVMLTFDQTTCRLFSQKIDGIMQTKGSFDIFQFCLPSGEQAKSLESYRSLCNALSQNEFCRNDIIVAVGGGSVTDLCGFVASTFSRGIRYANVATTLLCQIDACIGGKTAIDLGTKNSIGTFYHPSFVICDPLLAICDGQNNCNQINDSNKENDSSQTNKINKENDNNQTNDSNKANDSSQTNGQLNGVFDSQLRQTFTDDKTLANCQLFADGTSWYGELIKYCLLVGQDLISQVRRLATAERSQYLQCVEEIVTCCLRYKAKLVEADPCDFSQRRLLNFGHTIAHALEAHSNFTLSHGNAVLAGVWKMCLSSYFCATLSKDDLDKIKDLYALLGIDTNFAFPVNLHKYIARDKKREDDEITLAVICGIGNCVLKKFSLTQALHYLNV